MLYLSPYFLGKEITLNCRNPFRWLRWNDIDAKYSASRFCAFCSNLKTITICRGVAQALNSEYLWPAPRRIPLRKSIRLIWKESKDIPSRQLSGPSWRFYISRQSIHEVLDTIQAERILQHKVLFTSNSLKAARLLSPWTFASLANESLLCLFFHLIEDEVELLLRTNLEFLEAKTPSGPHFEQAETYAHLCTALLSPALKLEAGSI